MAKKRAVKRAATKKAAPKKPAKKKARAPAPSSHHAPRGDQRHAERGDYTTARELAGLRARIAEIEGRKLNREQQRSLNHWVRSTRERIVEEFLIAVPKGRYCEWAGRQQKVIDGQARTHDLPLLGPTVDLAAAVKALHDLVSANANRLRALDDADREELECEKLRKQIAKLQQESERLQVIIERERGDAIPKTDLAEALNAVAAQMRDYGRSLERISPAALEVFNAMLDHLADELESGRLAW